MDKNVSLEFERMGNTTLEIGLTVILSGSSTAKELKKKSSKIYWEMGRIKRFGAREKEKPQFKKRKHRIMTRREV